MELGGNITLEGFDSLEPAILIVVKKVVGNYAKKMSEITVFKSLKVVRNGTDIDTILILEGKEFSAKASHNNLFFALDMSLTQIIGKLK